MINLRHVRSIVFIAVTTGAASCISLLGGIGLESVQDKILPLVPMLIALPALNTMVGDYAAIIAAHAADPGESRNSKRELAKAIAKSIWVNIIGVLILSIALAHRRGYLFRGDFLFKFIAFVVLAMLLIVAVMFAITAALDKLLEKEKINADEVLIPIVTTITDVFMLGLITLAVLLIF